jgi:hypothetical protein
MKRHRQMRVVDLDGSGVAAAAANNWKSRV